MLVQIIFQVLSITLTCLFFLYGFNHYYLLNAAHRYKPPELPLDPIDDRPRVAVHLPIYNERYVIHRLISACVEMAENYGVDRVKILIIDDSDDKTIQEIDQEVADYQKKQINIEIQRRTTRQGYKAGALQAALEKTEEEFIAIFDADFIPPPEFLVRCMPYFQKDDCLGIIQCRWSHINRNYNILTGAIATGIDVHFLIEQPGRYTAGCFQNFNGSGGILRAKALIEVGGWQADTLTEDLDASYRMQLKGYRVLYLRDIQSPGEVPPTVPGYKKQQGRWACGSLRTAKKILPSLLSDQDIGFKQRLEAFIHLTGYLVHPMMVASFLLASLATLLHINVFRFSSLLVNLHSLAPLGVINKAGLFSATYMLWALVGLFIILCTIAAWIPPLIALKLQPLPVWKKLFSFLILFLLGCGISLSNTIEAGKALLTNKNWAFKRTPKYAIRNGKEQWRDKHYQISLDFVWVLELFLVCLGGISIGYSIWNKNYGVLLILIPFTAAYAFVASLTILQSQQEPGK